MSSQPPPIPDAILWSRLRPDWRSLPAAERRTYLSAAASHLHARWMEGAVLSALPLSLLAFARSGDAVTVRLPATDLVRGRHPATPVALLDTFAGWNIQVRDTLSAREALFFFKAFMRQEHMDHSSLRHAIHTVNAMTGRQIRSRARELYRLHLAEENPSREGLRCDWQPDASMTADQLLAIVEAIEREPSTEYLKSNPIIRVMRANVLGHDALIKRYDLPRWTDRVKYRFRESRARRAWAAGRTLLSLGIPTPEPLGYLEVYEGRVPVRSYIIAQFMADAVPTYKWVKANYHKRSPEWRARFSKDLLKSFLSLYERGIYHADTKTSNVLMTHADDPALRAFHWIDLECVESGITANRHQIVRNLVQLNGSFRHWVPEEDRIAFLHGMAHRYPWLDSPCIIEKIRKWTLRRWRNEIHKHIGP